MDRAVRAFETCLAPQQGFGIWAFWLTANPTRFGCPTSIISDGRIDLARPKLIARERVEGWLGARKPRRALQASEADAAPRAGGGVLCRFCTLPISDGPRLTAGRDTDTFTGGCRSSHQLHAEPVIPRLRNGACVADSSGVRQSV
jgi:hypothetical protein